MWNPLRRFTTAVLCTAILLEPASALAVEKLVTLLNFDGNDGGNPGPIIADGKGNLFGTTHDGGSQGQAGPGTIYEMSPAKGGGWAFNSLYSFTDGDDGGYPNSAPVIGGDGTLYGTAEGGAGGKAPGGVVYGLVPQNGSWTFETLYEFQGTSDGTVDTYIPLFTHEGKVYGVTITGGTSAKCGSKGCGTLFELKPPRGGGVPWKRIVLFNFPGGDGGSMPVWITPAGSGRQVYVATGGGNGAVVSLAPAELGQDWTETVLYSFAGGTDGEEPGSLVVGSNDTLFGLAGGGSNGVGLAFSLAQSNGTWVKTTLYNFKDRYGPYGPSSLTLAPGGKIVGTVFGDYDLYYGNVFRLSPPVHPGGQWKYRLLYDFNRGPSPNPNNVVFGKGGHIYGTLEGGDANFGAIFELR